MAIDSTSMNRAKSWVRIACGNETAAYIHRDHMSIPCKDEDTLNTLIALLEELPSTLVLERMEKTTTAPLRVRIRWA